MATELVPNPRSCTLYELEDSLQALVNTVALADDPSACQTVLAEIGQALRKTKEKRDAVVAFLRHCEQQQKFADAEIERIEKRKALIGRTRAALESYLARVIDQFGVPDRRGIKRLDGNFSSIRIQKNPDSVVITDEQLLPAAWKDLVLTMPAYAWEALLQRLDAEERKVFEEQVKKREVRPDKRSIAAELKNGAEIAGADLKFGEFRLVID